MPGADRATSARLTPTGKSTTVTMHLTEISEEPADRAACVFCRIIDETEPAARVRENTATVIFRPLGPVVAGHVLVVPRRHVQDAADDPSVTAATMHDAAVYAQSLKAPFNIITSAGREATQSVFHLHVHVVPRTASDQLMVPWGTLFGENPQDPHRCRQVRELERQLLDDRARVEREVLDRCAAELRAAIEQEATAGAASRRRSAPVTRDLDHVSHMARRTTLGKLAAVADRWSRPSSPTQEER